MKEHSWKRAVELTSPLWLVVAALVSRQYATVPFSWTGNLHAASAFVLLAAASVLWCGAFIGLRPLTAEGISPRARFCLLSSLAVSWAFGFHVSVRFWDTAPQIDTNRLLSFIPTLVLIWGIRERLSATTPAFTEKKCAACGYSRVGLPEKCVCPECGSAA